MNRTATAVALAVAVLAPAGCASQASTVPPPAPAASSTAATSVQGGNPAAPQAVTYTCTLGWQNYSTAGSGGAIGPFHRGAAPPAGSGAVRPADAWAVTLRNGTGHPVTLDWAQTTFYLHGQQVGTQTVTLGEPETLAPGQSDDTGWRFGGLIVPGDAYANWPASAGSAPIENTLGTSCAVTSWGNATGQ